MVGLVNSLFRVTNQNKKEIKMLIGGNIVRHTKNVLALATASLLMVLGCRQAPEELRPVGTQRQKLTYGFSGYTGDKQAREGSANYESIWEVAHTYCSWKGGKSSDRFTPGGGSYDMPMEYLEYRSFLCMGDFFMELADGVKPTVLKTRLQESDSRVVRAVPSTVITAIFDALWSQPEVDTSGVGSTVTADSLERVEFEYLETTKQREQVKHMAFLAYQKALAKALILVVDNPGDPANQAQARRMGLYLSVDSWWNQVDGASKTGIQLMEELLASLSTIVLQLKEIKVELAEESMGQGIVQGDLWGNAEEFGRKPALRHLFGTLTNVDDTDIWAHFHLVAH